jgi:hypothetical protein
VFAPAYLFGLPSYRQSTEAGPVLERIKKIDFLGLFLAAAVWVSFTIAFTMAGGWPWNDGRTIGTIVAFAVTLALFTLQQVFCIFTSAENRSFPVHLLHSKSQVLLYIATAANITSLFVPVYFIPIYFQFVHNDPALKAAVRLLPYVVTTVSFNLSAGYLLSKIKYYMPIFLTSGMFMVIGSSLLTVYLDPATPVSYIYGFSVIAGIGAGLTLQIGYAVATLKAPDHIGGALTLLNVAQIGGSVIALVIAGRVFQSSAVRNLTEVLASTSYSDADIQSAVSGTQSLIFQQLSGSLRDQALLAITKAMQMSFILPCVGC